MVGVAFTLEERKRCFDKSPEVSRSRGFADVVQELYDFSLIGFYRPGGRGYGGSEYVFKYKELRPG